MPPREEIYRAPVELPGAPALGEASPDAFGAGVGRGMQQLGQTIHEAVLRDKRIEKARERSSENSQAGVAAAQLDEAVGLEINRLREGAPEDGFGHVEQAGNVVKALGEQYLSGIRDPRVRERWAPHIAEMQARITVAEDGWARGRRAQAEPRRVAEAGDMRNNQLRVADLPDVEPLLEQSIAATRTLIGGLEGYSADVLQRLEKEEVEKHVVAALRGISAQSPELAGQYLKTGKYNHYLTAPVLERLIGENEVDLAKARTAANRQQAALETQARDEIQSFTTLVDAGHRPPDEDFDKRVAIAEALGDQSLATRLKVMHGEVRILRVTENWGPADWAREIAGLEAKGDKRSAAENIQLQVFKKHRGASEARFSERPREAAAASGLPAPEVDWANPTREQAAALVRWHDSWKAASGTTGDFILPEDVAGQMRERARSGPAGQIEVAAQARALFGVRDGARVLRQVDPQDKDMQLFVGLPERTAQWLKRGAAALKHNDKLFDKDQAPEIWAEYAPAIPVDLRDAVRTAAKNILAGHAEEQNVTELEGDDFARRYRAAIHRAVGATGVVTDASSRQGGFVNWNGGKVWIPQNMTGQDFARRLSRAKRADWVNAHSSADGQGPGGAPYYLGADGRPARLTDAMRDRLRDYQLVVTPVIGVYQLKNPRDGGVLVDKHGRPWHFRADKL